MSSCIIYSIIISFIILLIYFINNKMYTLIFSYDIAFPYSSINLSKLYNYNLQKNKINLYYINLDRSINRKQRFLNRFDKFNNYNIIRVKAVTPNDLPNYNIQSSLLCSTLMKPVEYCCTLSHLKSINISYNNNDQYSLIAEDDLIITKNINWEYLISKLPKNWDIIQLYNIPNLNINNSKKINTFKKNWLIKTNSTFYSTVFYLISRKGMKNILNRYLYNNNYIMLTKHNKFCVADILIYSKINRYIFTIPLFKPEDMDSTINTFNLKLRTLF